MLFPHLRGRAVLRDLTFGGSRPCKAFSERELASSSLQTNSLADTRNPIPQFPLDIQVKGILLEYQVKKRPISILQGTLDLMILRTLAAMGPQHAYGIASRIEQASGDQLNQNQGTIYPALI